MTPVVLRSAAGTEVTEAFRWYAERSFDLAADFLLAVDDMLRDLRENGRAFPSVRPAIRRCLLPHYPYAIYYHVSDTTISVVAVLHSPRRRRAPPAP